MPAGYITSKEELEQAVNQAVSELFERRLPQIIRRSNRKEMLTVQELAEFTGWSKRTIYYLKNEHKIPFIQENHRILFRMDDIEEYFHKNEVRPDGFDQDPEAL